MALKISESEFFCVTFTHLGVFKCHPKNNKNNTKKRSDWHKRKMHVVDMGYRPYADGYF